MTLLETKLASRVALTMELEDIADKGEITGRQRSRATWVKQCDRNTMFSHRIANVRWRSNTMYKLKVRDIIVEVQKK